MHDLKPVAINCSMKKKITAVMLTALFIFMILHPEIILEGAKTGILLWFEAVLPSLLPYMIISSLVITAGFSGEMAFIMRPVAKLFGIDPASAYCILSGIFFGYPSCAVSALQMYKNGVIGKDAACFCVCAFNNISPAFIAGFFCTGMMGSPSLIAPVLILFYISLLLSAAIIRLCFFRKISRGAPQKPHDAAVSGNFFDAAILSALTNIAKLGGYIVVFSIIAAVVSLIPWKYTGVLCGLAEATTGIQRLAGEFADKRLLISLVMPLLSFGGISGIFQTFGVDTEGIVDKKKYILSKLIAACVSAAAGFCAAYGTGIIKGSI